MLYDLFCTVTIKYNCKKTDPNQICVKHGKAVWIPLTASFVLSFIKPGTHLLHLYKHYLDSNIYAETFAISPVFFPGEWTLNKRIPSLVEILLSATTKCLSIFCEAVLLH